ncbi:MAG: hypothetical protein ACRDNE_15415 [Gaiellaceae bacterium]
MLHSERLGWRFCWGCYHGSFSDAEKEEAERTGLQREIARAIREAAELLADARRRKALEVRALLIELEPDEGALMALLEEVKALGFGVEIDEGAWTA